MYIGPGAGMMPTATAVVADLMELASNRLNGCRGRVAPLGLPLHGQSKGRLLPAAEVRGTFYLRFEVSDRPGVLAHIAGLLARAQVSIATVVQREHQRRGKATVVLQTHEAGEHSLRRAVRAIEKLATVHGKASLLRIEERLF